MSNVKKINGNKLPDNGRNLKPMSGANAGLNNS